MANAKRTQRLDMNSLKYVVEFDNPGARGGVARTVGLYKFGCFWVDDGDDRFPPAAEDSIYTAVREIDLWAA